MLVVSHCTAVKDNDKIRMALWAEGQEGRPVDIFVLYKMLHFLGLSSLDSSPSSNISLHLPGQKGTPKPSHPLLTHQKTVGRIGLIETRAAAILLTPQDALKFFRTVCCTGDSPPAQMLIGADLGYWLEVMKWLAGFLVRQDLIPGIYSHNGKHKARFYPFFKAPASNFFSRLVKSMPPCCLCACGAGQGWGQRVAAELLYDVSVTMIEAMSTEALSRLSIRDILFNHRSESIHDAWLYSLASGEPIHGDRSTRDQYQEQSIETLELSTRTRNVLIKNGIKNLGDILSQSEFDLLTLNGFGGKCLLEVLGLLDSMGLKLKKRESITREPPMDIDSLYGQIRAWHRHLIDQAWTNFRLALRLEEPERQNSPWTLRFLVQDLKDPSLIIPASEIWKHKKGAGQKKYFRYPAQNLIAGLGRAATIFPPIKKGLNVPEPGYCDLDVQEAYQFLSEGAWLLEEDGFAVFLPSWWSEKQRSKPTIQASIRVKPSSSGAGPGLSLEDPLRFDLEIALGDDPIKKTELQQLAKLKAPLIRLRGKWVELRREDIQAALAVWNNQDKIPLTVRDAINIGLGGQVKRQGVRFTKVQTTGCLQELINGLKTGENITPADPPKGLRAELRPYQQRGLSWLYFLTRWNLGACLADDMGLGKTLQALSLIQKRVEEGEKKAILLVCPTSVLGNWIREAARFTPCLKVHMHHGRDRKRGKELAHAAAAHHIVLTSFSLVHRDLDELKKIKWGGLIVDEAQNIKNYRTMQSRAIRSIQAPVKIAMTGTPVENSVSDLWSIMEFLNPGLLGSQQSFKRDFLVPIQVRGDEDAYHRLKQITGPFILRRLKTDKKIISDLPEKIETDVFVPLTREQASLYQAVVDEMSGSLDEVEEDNIRRRGMILAALTRLKQICDHPSLFLKDKSRLSGRSGKLTRLEEMIDVILSEGGASLIFTQFAKMGELLTKHLTDIFGVHVLFIHGGVPRSKRDRIVKTFQKPQGPPLMILSLRAAGTGLNLTRATHVFHFDRWWNPAVENQATDRTFRIGQKQNVQVHKFICQGTVEERISELIRKKSLLADKIVSSGESWITELSTSEIKNLIRLDTSKSDLA